MTMLMHTHGSLEQAPSSMRRRTFGVAISATRLAAIKRLCIGALTVLAAFGAITAIVALKAAVYYWRFH